MITILSVLFVSIIGLMFGNYATTAFYRIPNGKAINGYSSLNGTKPHCSHCGHLLKFYEYLPLLSWFSTGFKCNYCNAKTNPVYTILEVLGLFYALLFYFILGFRYEYILLLCNWVCFSLLLMLFLIYKRMYYKVLMLQLLLFGGLILWKIV